MTRTVYKEMEAKSEDVLRRGSRKNVDERKNKGTKSTPYIIEDSQSPQPSSLNEALSFYRNLKNKNNRRGFVSERHCYRSHLNYVRTKKPVRLMCFQNGEWIDLSSHILEKVRNVFELRRGAMEFQSENYHFIVDFLRKTFLNLKSGVELPMAWIDEVGSCYFPEILTSDKKDDYLVPFSTEAQQDMEVNRDEGEGSCDSNINGSKKSHEMDVEFKGDFLVDEEVKKMFHKGMDSVGGADIVKITKCSGARIQLFRKQVDIIERYRGGDANVRYAWLASPKEALSCVASYGIPLEFFKFESFGVNGVPLAAENFSGNSAKLCIPDENGVKHTILCRVVLGSMELVNPESKQFHPSSEEFDTGVDDLQNPKQYTVWSMNINTHIYPEYIVSFKKFHLAEAQHAFLQELRALAVHAQQCPHFQTDIAGRPMIDLNFPPENTQINSQRGQATRMEFITKMKEIVGDSILKSIVGNLQEPKD